MEVSQDPFDREFSGVTLTMICAQKPEFTRALFKEYKHRLNDRNTLYHVFSPSAKALIEMDKIVKTRLSFVNGTFDSISATTLAVKEHCRTADTYPEIVYVFDNTVGANVSNFKPAIAELLTNGISCIVLTSNVRVISSIENVDLIITGLLKKKKRSALVKKWIIPSLDVSQSSIHVKKSTLAKQIIDKHCTADRYLVIRPEEKLISGIKRSDEYERNTIPLSEISTSNSEAGNALAELNKRYAKKRRR